MKLLILTQYFPPETGAPQNRLFELARRLARSGVSVSVLTAMPNYPEMAVRKEYRGKIFMTEVMEGVTVYRSWIYASRSRSVFRRLLNYFSFVFTSMGRGLFIPGRFDILFCESPPLFLGISAWVIKTVRRCKMIFNVSDLWPQSARELGIVTSPLLLRMASGLESFLYRSSAAVTGQTQGIVRDISSRFPSRRTWWLRNGVDSAFFDPARHGNEWRRERGYGEEDFIVLYAGILGHAQGLDVILHAAAALREEDRIKFVVAGDGPEREKLLNLAGALGLSSVEFTGLITRQQMPSIISSCDAGVIPLKNLPLFRGAIPSKIFEFLSMAKPVLLGVEGEAMELFIDRGKAGFAFEPGNAGSLARTIRLATSDRNALRAMGGNGRKLVLGEFDRKVIAENFLSFLKTVHEGNRK